MSDIKKRGKTTTANREPEKAMAPRDSESTKTGSNGGYEQRGSQDKPYTDTPALISFVTALIIFFALGGYLFWRGIEPWSDTVKDLEAFLSDLVKTEKIPGQKKTRHASKTPAKEYDLLKKRTHREKLKPTGKGEFDKDISKILEKAVRIPVSISSDFTPVKMTIVARSRFHPGLSGSPPAGILKEPRYRGPEQKYGKLTLGTGNNRVYYFVFDIIAGPHPILYFDRNQNQDLTDDGPPLENKGSGIFATVIEIPMAQIIKEIDAAGNFKIWFFTNKSLWPKGITRHYSRTQMKGHVAFSGKRYMAFIAEVDANDADFTNDGIYIDLDRDGKIAFRTEYFEHRKIASIAGKDYWFDIQW